LSAVVGLSLFIVGCADTSNPQPVELPVSKQPDRANNDSAVDMTPRERAIAENQAMSLNEAYETLKDAVKRAQALLARAGIASPVGESRTIEDRELLMEAMEAREALAEAEDLEAVKRLAERAQQEDAACIKALTAAFAERDWDEAIRHTTRLKYWRKFAEELRGRRAVLAGAAV